MRWWSRRGIAKLFFRAVSAKDSALATPEPRSPARPLPDARDADAEKTRQLDVTMVVPPPHFDSDSDPENVLTQPDAETSRSGSDGFADTLAPEPTSYTARRLNGVAGYDILEELGRGGMGVVYRARHRNLQRQVALKMILAGAHAGKAGLARFRAEAEAVAQLQHPNIVQVFETGEHDGCPYFSLELVTGGSLDKRIRDSTLSPQSAARMIETLARAIGFAHQRGIIHRDLKPGNILLAPHDPQSTMITAGLSATRRPSSSGSTITDGDWSRSVVPKITDFGLAKRLDDDSGQTHTGTVLGTPNYMSPEQADGRIREVGPATDIYALGSIFYELLIGRPPFKSGNPIDVIRQVIDQEPVPPRQLEPRVPLDIETICLKCLEKQPARRYETAEDLADDLHRFLADEPILARPISATERAWKWAKRRPSTVALMAVCVAAVIGTGLFIAWHNISLRDQLDLALAEERQARRNVAEAIETQRLSQLEIEGQRLYDGARVAMAANDLPSAQLDLTKALTILRSEPRLTALREAAESLLADVDQKLIAVADRLASRERLTHFVDLRDEAQFLGTLYTGMDLAANLQASREAVHEALAVYGVSATYENTLTVDEHLDESEQTQICGDCYQLLLILAETEAQSSAVLDEQGQRHQLEEALRVLDQAPRFGTPSKAYHLRRARYLHSLGDHAAATQEESLAEAAEVSDALDHFLIADELYRRGEYDVAISEFEQVLQSQPDHFWAQYLSGLCLLRQHRPAEARSHLTACLAQGRAFVWLYLLRGFANGELKAFDAADADFRKALQMPLDENSRYVLFVNRGVLRIRQDRFEDAIADLNEAIKLKPTEYQAFVNLAQAYRRQNDLDLAIAQLDLAITIQPSLDQLYRLRARLHVERNESDAALDDFDTAIRLASANSPLLADDYVERGRLLLLVGKHEAALASLDAALRLREAHSLAQRLRAETLFRLGRFDEVITAFDRYLETGKPLESVYRGRGLAKSELGAYPGAIEDFTKALELQPTSAVQAYRGWMHVVVGATQLAERDFALAIELDAANGDAHNGRGFVRAIQGDFAGAIEDAENALKLGPRSPQLVYNAARIHAQSARSGDLRVFDLIRESLSLLPQDGRVAFWSRQVRTDAALDSIRRYPQYLQMERELLTQN
jgi:serine/threonine protein kinase/Tfp pilus assembly protein PilF